MQALRIDDADVDPGRTEDRCRWKKIRRRGHLLGEAIPAKGAGEQVGFVAKRVWTRPDLSGAGLPEQIPAKPNDPICLHTRAGGAAEALCRDDF
jgi:hypothetical protein